MIRPLSGSAIAAIQAGQARAARAADDIAQVGAGSRGDSVSLSAERPRGAVGAMVDLRVARYQVAAGVATLRTYDEITASWLEGDRSE